MSRRWIIVALLIIVGAIVFRVLTYSDPTPEKIERRDGATYQLNLTRFSEGEGLTCPPFNLDILYDRQRDLPRNIIMVEQGDDILIAQTRTTVYVFYSEIVLHSFGGWIADTKDAKPLLCDINLPICASEMRRLTLAGVGMQRICESDGKWQRQTGG